MKMIGVLVVAAFLAVGSNADSASYLVTAPKVVRPDTDYDVTVTIFQASGPVTVTAEITEINQPAMVSQSASIGPDTMQKITLRVPAAGFEGNKEYYLQVTGTGGAAFSNSTKVKVVMKSLSVFVQTDKAMYKPGNMVNFRAIAVYPNLLPYTGNMDIEIYDGKGNKVKQLLNQQNSTGVVTGQLMLSDMPIMGDWQIKVTAKGENVKKNFTVAEYTLPKYEVKVNLPSYILHDDSGLTGSVSAKYTFGKPVRGEVQITIKGSAGWSRVVLPTVTKNMQLKKGAATFTVPMQELKNPNERYTNLQTILVTAKVTETVTGNELKGDGTVKVERQKYKLKFMDASPNSFKPGLAYVAFLQITQPDDQPLTQEMLTETDGSRATVDIEVTLQFSGTVEDEYVTRRRTKKLTLPVPDHGTVRIELDETGTYTSITINANFRGVRAYKYGVQKFKSRDDKGIQVSKVDIESTVQADSDLRFVIKSTEEISTFQYQIMSKGRIIESNKLNRAPGNRHDILIRVTPDLAHKMAPGARIVAWYKTAGGEIISDSLDFIVDGAFLNDVSIAFDKATVEPAENLTVRVTAAPDSYIGLLAVDQSVLLLKSGNDISQDQVVQELRGYDSTDTASDGGYGPVLFRGCIWPIFSGGDDSSEIFEEAGVAVMTDAYLYKKPSPVYPMAEMELDMMPGIQNAGILRKGPINDFAAMDTDMRDEDLQEVERVRNVFPETWLWTDRQVGSNGETIVKTTAPDTITSWVASAFAVHSSSGLGVAPTTAKTTVFKPFFITINMPYSLIRTETFQLKAVVFNYLSQDLEVLVTLERSNQFKVKKLTNSVDAKEHEPQFQEVQDRITVRAGDATDVSFWVEPVALGHIPFTIKAQSNAAADAVTRMILVEPEGTPQEYSNSLFLDLSQSGGKTYVKEIPMAFPPTEVVDGSERITFSVVGDVMGPSIRGLERLLRVPYGCGEQNMLTFAPNIFVLQYLEATDSLTSTIESKAKRNMETGYQRELNYQHPDGSFSAFGDNDPSGSMWLTAFVMKCFSQASPYVTIDPNELYNMTQWILQQQEPDGTFPEPGSVIHTEMQGGSSKGVALTAYTVIALLESRAYFTNETELVAAIDAAVQRAKTYLERKVDEVSSNPYILAIITYGLTLAQSDRAEYALMKLNTLAKTTPDGDKYWTTVKPTPPTTDGRWKSPYGQAKASDIELNAYALLVYKAMGDVSGGIPIMKWLVSQRNELGGYSSTQDTVMALQALAAFASTMPGSADMSISVTAGSYSHQFDTINEENALLLQSVELPDPRSVNMATIRATGSGYGLVQMSVNYNVERIPNEPGVVLRMETEKINRNEIYVKACGHYNGTAPSGMVLLQVRQLSGFVPKETPDELVKKFRRQEVEKVESKEKDLTFYFNQIDRAEQCVFYHAQRVEMVDKLQPARATISRYYDPTSANSVYYKTSGLSVDQCDLFPETCPEEVVTRKAPQESTTESLTTTPPRQEPGEPGRPTVEPVDPEEVEPSTKASGTTKNNEQEPLEKASTSSPTDPNQPIQEPGKPGQVGDGGSTAGRVGSALSLFMLSVISMLAGYLIQG